MEIKNGIEYNSNYARAAAYFLGSCADEPDSPSRKAAYTFITDIYKAIIEDASFLGLKTSPDVHFAKGEQQKERQNDVKTIKTANDKLEALITELLKIVSEAEACSDGLIAASGVKPGKLLLKALQRVGADYRDGRLLVSGDCAEGLSELSHISGGGSDDKAFLYFSRCVFEPASDWLEGAFDRLIDANGEIVRLCGELRELGYDRVECKEGKKLSLDYVRQHGKKAEPVKMSWADKTHSGIELSYEYLKLEPYYLWLRVPMFKTVLERASELPERVTEFFERSVKNCNGCRYCVQTDKTGTRPLAAVKLGNFHKCPYYPAFSLNWIAADKPLVDDIIAVIKAVNALGV